MEEEEEEEEGDLRRHGIEEWGQRERNEWIEKERIEKRGSSDRNGDRVE